MKTTILLTIDHQKPVPELTDLVANRIYTFMKNMDASADVTAEIDESKSLLESLHLNLEFDGNGFWIPEVCFAERQRDNEECEYPNFDVFKNELKVRFPSKIVQPKEKEE